MPEQPLPLIDHPVHPHWRETGYVVMTPERRSALAERFADYTPDQLNDLVALVGKLSLVVDRIRVNYEESTVGMLMLDRQGHKHYEKLAGRAESIGEYIHWYSNSVDEFFKHTSVQSTPKKMGLEVAGSRLGTDWEYSRRPGGLDETTETIPHRIDESGKETEIDIHYSRGAIKVFGFMPYYRGNHEFEEGILRRKRSVADIRIGDSPRPLKLFKDSRSILKLSELPWKERVYIERQVMATQTADTESAARAQAALNAITGEIFEREVVTPAGTTRSVLPLSAQVVMFKDRLKVKTEM